MAQDTEDGFNDVDKKTTILKKYKKVSSDIEDLRKKSGKTWLATLAWTILRISPLQWFWPNSP